jgi:hypothetical protein
MPETSAFPQTPASRSVEGSGKVITASAGRSRFETDNRDPPPPAQEVASTMHDAPDSAPLPATWDREAPYSPHRQPAKHTAPPDQRPAQNVLKPPGAPKLPPRCRTELRVRSLAIPGKTPGLSALAPGSPTPQAPRHSLDPTTPDTLRLAAMECGENHRFALGVISQNRPAPPTGQPISGHAPAVDGAESAQRPPSRNAQHPQGQSKAASSRTHSTAASRGGGLRRGRGRTKARDQLINQSSARRRNGATRLVDIRSSLER